ncbi:MAG TPA: DUF2911 domain-containing protein [Saprospiraceae bacterium]|nr:DUF2911 domain-containing protein [Saprospiraceae bacterium]
MKSFFNLLLIPALSLLLVSADAQIKTPAASPSSKVETTVGLTNVTLDYSRPSKNGRKIFGDLVPFGSLWRTGANKNSIVTFSDDVMIGGKEVKKGSYAIFTKPSQTSWEVTFYTDTENWGTPEKWDDAKVAAKVMVSPQAINTVETFTLNVGNVTNESFHLEIMWDNVNVPVKIEVPTDKKVSSSITAVMAGPSANDYYNAARYYREAKKDLTQALAWMNKSVEMGNDKFWILRQKSLIEADMGNFKAAIATANESLAKAKEAGNNDYIKMNMDSIAAWSKK